ncbi:MAG TPA: adenylate/guanylate cyclase domain-containing protein [Chitinophagaceae bacterium]|nr:adenylate/guanylate cyclase domain-containing protein [Chitinophagaceae bacterium]
MTKILVVDDEADLEALIKQKFRRQIREKEFEFVFAVNGVHALKTIEDNPDVDVVLSDINMPEMDGLTLLVRLSDMSPVIKTVIVSAYGDMDNIRAAMNRGAFDFICKPVNFEDLEITVRKTIRQVAQIKQTLKAIKENNILKMYVDESVLNYMSKKEFEKSLMANESVAATVVFIDICGFTKITEHAEANAIVKMLNRYFDVMVKEIIAQNGHVDKFIGDAVMAVFKGEFHLDRAIDAALAVQRQIENLPAEDSGFKPHVSIGINTGELISGNIGSESLKRLDYTVIGDVVNTAQRLQSVARPGQILFSEMAYNQVKESFRCREIGEVELKNKEKSVKVYEVLE